LGNRQNAPFGQERECCISGKEIRFNLLSPPNGRNFEKRRLVFLQIGFQARQRRPNGLEKKPDF
jgi:hypothetical protein